MPGEYDYHDTDGQVRWPMAEPTTTDSGINRVMELEEQVRSLTAERDELKESLRTTRLEQAAKAFQVDDLETKVWRLTFERDSLANDIASNEGRNGAS